MRLMFNGRLRIQWIKSPLKRSRSLVGFPRDPKEEYTVWGLSFWAENTLKSGPFNTENKAQTLHKQVQNNFEKVEESTFLTLKMVKNHPSNRPKWANFWPKISIFEVIYTNLELKIHVKKAPLRPKTKPKHFPNKSKPTLKKSRNRLFWPQKWANFWLKISFFGVIYPPLGLKIQPNVGF